MYKLSSDVLRWCDSPFSHRLCIGGFAEQ